MKTLTSRLSLVFCAASLMASADTQAESIGDWGQRALNIQASIDNRAPLTETMWVGTHNSYNSLRWDSSYFYDPNQSLTLREQLNAGAREIVFDILPVGEALYLCHGACDGLNKKFREGLTVLRKWINNNPNEVIMLKLEAEEFRGKVGRQLDGEIGHMIYRPKQDGDCHALNPQQITKQDILDAGKNILVLTTPSHGCSGSPGAFNKTVFTGFEYDDGSASNKFKKYDTAQACLNDADSYIRTRITRLHDGATFDYMGSGTDIGVEYKKDNIQNFMECGMNVIELFNFGATNALMLGSGRHTEKPNLMPKHLVWSWANYEPALSGSGGKDCAFSNSGGRFTSSGCQTTRRFACYSESADTWRFTQGQGAWQDGYNMCSAEFGSDYSFSTPVNARQNAALVRGKATSNINELWINYSDQTTEGIWEANSRIIPYTLTDVVGYVDEGGTNDVNLFRAYVRDNQLDTLAKIKVRHGGAGVTGIELTYQDGTIKTHGDMAFDVMFETTSVLELNGNEHITSLEACEESNFFETNFIHRIRRISFHTNETEDRLVAGDPDVTQNCKTLSVDGMKLFGFVSTLEDTRLSSLEAIFTEERYQRSAMTGHVIDYAINPPAGGPFIEADDMSKVNASLYATSRPYISSMRIRLQSKNTGVAGIQFIYSDGTEGPVHGDLNYGESPSYSDFWHTAWVDLSYGIGNLKGFEVCISDQSNGLPQELAVKRMTLIGDLGSVPVGKENTNGLECSSFSHEQFQLMGVKSQSYQFEKNGQSYQTLMNFAGHYVN